MHCQFREQLRIFGPLPPLQSVKLMHGRDTYIQMNTGSLDEEDRVDAAIVLGVVGDLGVFFWSA